MFAIRSECNDVLVAEVRTYFERTADSFDRLYDEDGQPLFWRWINRHFRLDIAARYIQTDDHIMQSSARSVLDLGCGSGRYRAAPGRPGPCRQIPTGHHSGHKGRCFRYHPAIQEPHARRCHEHQSQ